MDSMLIIGLRIVADDINAKRVIWTYDSDLRLYFMSFENCSDCRILGNIEVPDFWE